MIKFMDYGHLNTFTSLSVMLFAFRTLCEEDQHCCHWTYRGSTKDGRSKTCWLKREKGVVVKKEEHRENKVFSGSINCPGSSYEPKNCPEPTTDTPAPTPDEGTSSVFNMIAKTSGGLDIRPSDFWTEGLNPSKLL